MHNKSELKITSLQRYKKQKKKRVLLKRIPPPAVLIMLFVVALGLIGLIGYLTEDYNHPLNNSRETEVLDPMQYPFLK